MNDYTIDRNLKNYISYLNGQNESKAIRRMELNMKKKARKLKNSQKHDDSQMSYAKHRLLHLYRVNELRVSNRISHLAQMYQKGVPFRMVEDTSKPFKHHFYTMIGFAKEISRLIDGEPINGEFKSFDPILKWILEGYETIH